MNLTKPVRRPSRPAASATRRTRMTDIAAHATTATHTAARVTDVPDRRSGRPITFNSAS